MVQGERSHGNMVDSDPGNTVECVRDTNMTGSYVCERDVVAVPRASRVLQWDVVAVPRASRVLQWDVVAVPRASRVLQRDVVAVPRASRVN